jgi:ankyrin repeat protein
LHEAANHGHYHVAQLLVKYGANVMATGLDDVTPLHDAASVGNQKLVKMLIDKGADPLFKNKKGKTPQDIAHGSLFHFFRTLGTSSGERNVFIFLFTRYLCEKESEFFLNIHRESQKAN